MLACALRPHGELYREGAIHWRRLLELWWLVQLELGIDRCDLQVANPVVWMPHMLWLELAPNAGVGHRAGGGLGAGRARGVSGKSETLPNY
jgi:hypothetical protein